MLASDLDSLSSFLQHNFNYSTGPYQGYNFNIPSTRFLGKLDYNLNDRNKLSVRYSMLNSNSDQLASNSNGQGLNGNRDNNASSMVFQNSNYKIKENNRSLAADLNSSFGGNKANDLIVGYYSSDESRDSLTATFPLIDIQNGGSTYMSAGFEPFTPGNQLRYHSIQAQDNFTIYGKNHDLNFGVSAEKYHSDNVFFPGSQSVYVYNSLAGTSSPMRMGTWRTRTPPRRRLPSRASRSGTTTFRDRRSRFSRSTCCRPAPTSRITGASART